MDREADLTNMNKLKQSHFQKLFVLKGNLGIVRINDVTKGKRQDLNI